MFNASFTAKQTGLEKLRNSFEIMVLPSKMWAKSQLKGHHLKAHRMHTLRPNLGLLDQICIFNKNHRSPGHT